MSSEPPLIREIRSSETHLIRQSVLRPHQAVAEMDFAGDHLEGTFHLGAFVGEQLVSIGSFYPESNQAVPEGVQYRLRFMATMPAFSRLGIGRALLEKGATRLTERNVDVLWCHARRSAVLFYVAVGFAALGAEFAIPNIGPHSLMLRQIRASYASSLTVAS